MSRSRDDDADMSEEGFRDPALKNFSRTAFIAKNVVKETAMGGVMGGLIGGAAFAAGSVALGGIAAASLGPVGWLLGSVGLLSGAATPVVTSIVSSAAMTGAMWGAGIGATVKGAMALGNASELADGEEERLVTKSQQAEMRRNRVLAIERQRDRQAVAMHRTDPAHGANMNHALPRRGGGAEREAMS